MTDKPKIDFCSVSKTFLAGDDDAPIGDAVLGVQALRDTTFSINEGEFVSILGPSGCGKTTVLNLVAGFIQPTSGNVHIEHRNERRTPLYGMVFQDDAAFPWMTVAENIGYALDNWGRGFARPEVASLVEVLQLRGFENKYPHELSGGMRKRVEIGRAYAAAPEILMFDEPFGSLDVLTKQAMQQFLSQFWAAERKTVIFVSHDVEECLLLSTRVLVMSPRPGRITHDFAVAFEFPRSNDLKFSNEFVRLRRQIVEALEGIGITDV